MLAEAFGPHAFVAFIYWLFPFGCGLLSVHCLIGAFVQAKLEHWPVSQAILRSLGALLCASVTFLYTVGGMQGLNLNWIPVCITAFGGVIADGVIIALVHVQHAKKEADQ